MQPNNQPPPPPPGMKIGDILYVLFRHKWKIVFFSVAGISVAAVMFFLDRPLYQSEAKLFVRYIQDSKSLGSPGGEPVRTPDSRGDNIINSEADILTSFDLATNVVDIMGVDKILPKGSKTRTRVAAAVFVQKHLTIDTPKKSSVIGVLFEHPDPDMVQPILRQLINSYYKKHVEVHKALGVFDEFLERQTDQLRSQLDQTDDDLRKLKVKAHIISLDDTKKSYNDQVGKLQQELYQAEAELAERQTTLTQMVSLVSARSPMASSPTSHVDVAEAIAPIPTEKITDYKRIVGRLDTLYKREEDLLSRFTDKNPLVKDIQTSITEAETLKKKLEQETPRLLTENVVVTKAQSAAQPTSPDFDFITERAKVLALAAKVKVLTSQFDRVRAEIGNVDEIEGTLTQLQRKKELQEKQYLYYSSSLEQAKIDDTLGAGKISNISEVQSPTPPSRDSKKLNKRLAMASGGGIFAGIALAFLIELLLDQTVKRPGEIEGKLRLPLFLSIPSMKQNGHRKSLRDPRKKLITAGTSEPPVDSPSDHRNGGTHTEVAPWQEEHALHPFFETLRDRLVTFFEARNLTHKPKLIAVTSCSKGAGVTTIAAALAASLSETGDGNVLLVDMNLQNGAAHPFFKGKPARGLADVLDHENRDTALVHDKLFMVRGETADDRLPRILPKRFAGLLPKLKASDYDYIIFDMPSVTQTSITPRLAGFMDAVLLIVEAEKTDRAVTERAAALLTASKANTVAILNKTRSYIPQWLHQEF